MTPKCSSDGFLIAMPPGKIAHILTDLLRFFTSLVTIVEVVE
jgi:hypothetical protein